jgi:hypothetical protein
MVGLDIPEITQWRSSEIIISQLRLFTRNYYYLLILRILLILMVIFSVQQMMLQFLLPIIEMV